MFRLKGRASVFKLLMGPKIDIVKPKLATNPLYISSRTYTFDFENPNKRHVGKHVSHDAPWPSGTGSALHGWPLGNKTLQCSHLTPKGNNSNPSCTPRLPTVSSSVTREGVNCSAYCPAFFFKQTSTPIGAYSSSVGPHLRIGHLRRPWSLAALVNHVK